MIVPRCWALIAAVAVVLWPTTGAVMHVHLTRHHHKSNISHILERHNSRRHGAPSSLLPPSATPKRSMTTYYGNLGIPNNFVYDTQFLGAMRFGTPPQTVNGMNFDSGSSDTWCVRGTPPQGFTASKSTTYRDLHTTASLQYGSPTNPKVTLEQSRDSVGVSLVGGNTKGLTITNFVLGLTSLPLPNTFNPAQRGIVGMGWPALAAFGNAFGYELVATGLTNGGFATWYNSSNPRSLAEAQKTLGGVITFGGTAPNLYHTPIVYVPVSSKTYWTITLTKIALGATVLSGNAHLIVDTGTQFIEIPSADVSTLIKGTPLLIYKQILWVPTAKISLLKPLTFTFGTHSFSMLPGQLFWRYVGNVHVTATINGVPCFALKVLAGNEFILGQPFLQAYYTVFDFASARIGFAHAIQKPV